jgi:hypothetical protein
VETVAGLELRSWGAASHVKPRVLGVAPKRGGAESARVESNLQGKGEIREDGGRRSSSGRRADYIVEKAANGALPDRDGAKLYKAVPHDT